MAYQSLARLAVLKDASLVSILGSAQDDSLRWVLQATTKAVEKYCNRQLVSATISAERHSGDGTKSLYLKQYPVLELPSAVGIWSATSETFAAELTSYMEVLEQRILYYPKLGQENNATHQSWPDTHPNNIQVTYVAGYDTTGWDADNVSDTGAFAVPSDLEAAVAEIAAFAWLDGMGSGQARLGLSQMTMGPDTMDIVKVEKGFTPKIQRMLADYMRAGF